MLHSDDAAVWAEEPVELSRLCELSLGIAVARGHVDR